MSLPDQVLAGRRRDSTKGNTETQGLDEQPERRVEIAARGEQPESPMPVRLSDGQQSCLPGREAELEEPFHTPVSDPDRLLILDESLNGHFKGSIRGGSLRSTRG